MSATENRDPPTTAVDVVPSSSWQSLRGLARAASTHPRATGRALVAIVAALATLLVVRPRWFGFPSWDKYESAVAVVVGLILAAAIWTHAVGRSVRARERGARTRVGLANEIVLALACAAAVILALLVSIALLTQLYGIGPSPSFESADGTDQLWVRTPSYLGHVKLPGTELTLLGSTLTIALVASIRATWRWLPGLSLLALPFVLAIHVASLAFQRDAAEVDAGSGPAVLAVIFALLSSTAVARHATTGQTPGTAVAVRVAVAHPGLDSGPTLASARTMLSAHLLLTFTLVHFTASYLDDRTRRIADVVTVRDGLAAYMSGFVPSPCAEDAGSGQPEIFGFPAGELEVTPIKCLEKTRHAKYHVSAQLRGGRPWVTEVTRGPLPPGAGFGVEARQLVRDAVPQSRSKALEGVYRHDDAELELVAACADYLATRDTGTAQLPIVGMAVDDTYAHWITAVLGVMLMVGLRTRARRIFLDEHVAIKEPWTILDGATGLDRVGAGAWLLGAAISGPVCGACVVAVECIKNTADGGAREAWLDATAVAAGLVLFCCLSLLSYHLAAMLLRLRELRRSAGAADRPTDA